MTNSPVRVGILEDQPLFREMLAGMLADAADIEVVCAVGTVAEANRVIAGHVDVAVLDVDVPDGNGVSLGIRLRRAHPETTILLLSAHNVMSLLVDLPDDVREGWSYLSKTSSTSTRTLIDAILATAAGSTVLDPALLAATEPRTGTAVATLTDRQYQVLRLLAEGLSNPGIGDRLGITEKSVQNHINAIYGALGIEPDPTYNPRVRAALTLLEDTGPIAA